jgi:23S rRNA pseudouridine1911/1915/1917 synthase
MQIEVSEEQIGQRVDVLVAAALPQLSRAYVHKLVDGGKVLLHGVAPKPGHKLHLGDKLEIDYDETAATTIPDIAIPIIYEDDDCVVMNKPAGVLTHALGIHGNEPSVASFLRGKVQGIAGERAGIVHRLDRATSGVIIGARNQTALSSLQKQFAQRKVKKTYVAVIEGELRPIEAVINMPIERNPKAPATFRVGPNGKAAVTHYNTLQTNGRYSLVELRPETGRTHQLRVHLAKLGHPIVGDPLYGSGSFGDRLFLYAQSLEITLPSREHKTFSAPLPPEFKDLAA